MTSLCARVNVIPVIAKADTLTAEELEYNKRLVMEDIRQFKIPIYHFPCESDDEESIEECMSLRSLVPFAIVGSNSLIKVDGEFVRGRKYPWGLVRVEEPEHSDFVILRSVLFGSHLQELKDITHDMLYEKYRTEKLSESTMMNSGASSSAHEFQFPPIIPAVKNISAEKANLTKIGTEVQREIEEKRQQIALKEATLKDIMAKLNISVSEIKEDSSASSDELNPKVTHIV